MEPENKEDKISVWEVIVAIALIPICAPFVWIPNSIKLLSWILKNSNLKNVVRTSILSLIGIISGILLSDVINTQLVANIVLVVDVIITTAIALYINDIEKNPLPSKEIKTLDDPTVKIVKNYIFALNISHMFALNLVIVSYNWPPF